ncbi:hypothetical protein GJ496_011072 [Pomphorhynchus laevis]|nr:hypothetical protein GJ496_011072 [Pomphorhynchus laevis]
MINRILIYANQVITQKYKSRLQMEWPDDELDDIQEDLMICVSQAYDKKENEQPDAVKVLTDRNVLLEVEVAKLRHQQTNLNENKTIDQSNHLGAITHRKNNVDIESWAKKSLKMLTMYTNTGSINENDNILCVNGRGCQLVQKIAHLKSSSLQNASPEEFVKNVCALRETLSHFTECLESILDPSSSDDVDIEDVEAISKEISELYVILMRNECIPDEIVSSLSNLQIILFQHVIDNFRLSNQVGRLLTLLSTCQTIAHAEEKADKIFKLILKVQDENRLDLRNELLRALTNIGQLPDICNIKNSDIYRVLETVDIIKLVKIISSSKSSDKNFIKWFATVLYYVCKKMDLRSKPKRTQELIINTLLSSLKWRLGSGKFVSDINLSNVPIGLIQLSCLILKNSSNGEDHNSLVDYFSAMLNKLGL